MDARERGVTYLELVATATIMIILASAILPMGRVAVQRQREIKLAFSVEREGLKFSAWDFTSQPEVRLRLYFLEAVKAKGAETVALEVLYPSNWANWLRTVRVGFENELKQELQAANSLESEPGFFEMLKPLLAQKPALAFFAPRGVGLTAWSANEKKLTQIRRRFMLLGQTLDGMQVWNIRRAVQTIHFVREGDTARIELRAADTMSWNAGMAALFEPPLGRIGHFRRLAWRRIHSTCRAVSHW